MPIATTAGGRMMPVALANAPKLPRRRKPIQIAMLTTFIPGECLCQGKARQELFLAEPAPGLHEFAHDPGAQAAAEAGQADLGEDQEQQGGGRRYSGGTVRTRLDRTCHGAAFPLSLPMIDTVVRRRTKLATTLSTG